ncbi:hypothetical protein [Alteromonas lipolytica]|uniref:Uncharacterized protein n=1 Tax=Alteromonas lipolytica TaxID=1856405 RepID=A0A1E8FFV9_9ALTE|nr:hypothetical protein [Alteromonas lipolytica]OFI34810.1 hypothetical protein BFC17_14640 [Alteromonas lipolytica]GGF54175.1 hypothetical protein GCM10011338_02950 [Alteromonas lipolytica]
MKTLERAKAQKSLSKIESGDFDENDVDNIFTRLRAYCRGHKIFHEVSHFVAHNDERDRGLTFESLESVYLNVKFFLEYASPKKPLDIRKPFPLYIKKLLSFQADKCADVELKKKFNVSRDRLKKRIDSIFAEDKKKQVAYLRKPKVSEDNFKAIQHLLGFISTRPAFSQEQLISEFIAVLEANKLQFNEEALRKHSGRITACVLLLINDAEFKVSPHKSGYCKVSCEQPSVSYKQTFVDKDGNPVEREESHGNLLLTGHVILDKDGKDLTIAFAIMDTELPAEDWCDESMFYIEPLSEKAPSFLQKKINFEPSLCLNSEGKLGILGTD